MKFLIVSHSTPPIQVDMTLGVPKALKDVQLINNYEDYFKYFSEKHFHMCKFKSIKFSSDTIEGSQKDLNKFIWLVMAHQAYMERSFFIEEKFMRSLEQSISSIFDRDKEVMEWFAGLHRAIDIYIGSQTPEVMEFLPATIQPLDEITNLLTSMLQEIKPQPQLASSVYS